MVLFAGIAAEALVYGEAEGGENDENLFRNVCLLLEPPLTVIEVSLQLIYSLSLSIIFIFIFIFWVSDSHFTSYTENQT